MSDVPILHGVTTDEVILDPGFVDRAAAFMRAAGPRGALHLRTRSATGRRLYDVARAALAVAHDAGALVVINDRVDVACAAGVSYVQLTSRSMSVRDAATVSPDLVVGASVHTRDEAASAQAAGAVWCVAGPAFRTDTHPGTTPGGSALIAAVASVVTIPVIAIGGVTPERVPELLAAGAHGAAAISGIWHSSDVGEAVRRYLTSYDGYERDG